MKAEANLRKHRVSFGTAAHVFDDPDAVADHDRIEGGERRWQMIGMVGGVLLLLVAHTVDFEDDENEVIRIISARARGAKGKATV